MYTKPQLPIARKILSTKTVLYVVKLCNGTSCKIILLVARLKQLKTTIQSNNGAVC